jgi:hypothetical protein
MFERGWYTTEINTACGRARRTPVLESVPWNRRSLYRLLVAHGADVKATARNLFDEWRNDRTALHIFAHAVYNEDITLAQMLIDAGVPVDGIVG